jgi:hypothetical protein
MGSRGARVVRGLLASAVAIFVAALFHVAGGGAAPGVVPLVLSLAFASLASVALTARRLSLWRLTGAVSISQLLFHLLFGLGSGTATFSSSTGGTPGASAGLVHVHPGMQLVMTSGTMPAGHVGTAPSMWVAHIVAAAITVAALRFGEQSFWGLLHRTRMHVARVAERLVATPILLTREPSAIPLPQPVRMRDLGIPLGRLRHRGPPPVVCAF